MDLIPDRASTSKLTRRPVVVCLSGKRKSGKDYAARLLVDELESLKLRVASVGISDPLKEEFASLHQHLDSEELKTDSAYKERVRKEMVDFGERMRSKDPGYFCRYPSPRPSNNGLFHFRQAIARAADETQVVVVRDCRRPTDIAFFRQNFEKILLVRIQCSADARTQRGYEFTSGIDDAETECALDGFHEWDVEVVNEGNSLAEEVQKIGHLVLQMFSAPNTLMGDTAKV